MARASEESAHAAWVERVKSAVPAAARALKDQGRPSRPLATVESKEKTKSSAYGDVYSRRGWWELKERVGRGWILFTATYDQVEGDTTRATIVLTEDGRLFWAQSENELELGRKRLLGGPRETVVAVTGELNLNEKTGGNRVTERGLTLEAFAAATEGSDRAKEQALTELEARLETYLA